MAVLKISAPTDELRCFSKLQLWESIRRLKFAKRMFRHVVRRFGVSIVFVSLFFVLPVSPFSRLSALSNAIVHPLDESNFERETRASTGQSRGQWFVLFATSAPAPSSSSSLSPHQDKEVDDYDKILHELVVALSNNNSVTGKPKGDNNNADDGTRQSADKGTDAIHVARVNILTNPKLSQRFEIRFLPTLLYFANQRMYTYRGPTTLASHDASPDAVVDAMYTFVTTRYATMDGATVPSAPTFVDDAMEIIRIQLQRGNRFRIVLMEDLDHIRRYRKNAAALLIVLGGICGAILTALLWWTISQSKSYAATSDKTKDD